MERLESRRLVLRPVGAADREAVIAAAGDLAVSRWLSVVPHPYGDADFDFFLREIAIPGRAFAVEDAAGFCGIVDIGGGVLGYWMAPGAQGRGYATEAARLALAAHFARTDAPVTAGHFADNLRSAHVLRKLGFAETGRDKLFCKALGEARAHVAVSLGKAGFLAALPIEAVSARLAYRGLWPTDAAALHEIVRHWAVMRQLGAFWPWPADPAMTARRARPFGGEGFVWGLLREGVLIGTVAVTEGALGYMLHPAHHRQGLMREAVGVALGRAFGPMGMAQVTASVWADNAASLGLLQGFGFVVTGSHMGTTAARPEPSPGLDLVLRAADWRGA
ncbi:MAG: GNAT family N-acetyltransferase [Paracoccaceae bacterium]